MTSSYLSSLLDRDLLAADFLVGIFWSAMTSFRHDTILRPFPPSFVDERGLPSGSHKNMKELVRQCVYAQYLYAHTRHAQRRACHVYTCTH